MPSLTHRKNVERPAGALNTSELAKAAGVPYKTVNTWAQRGHLRTIGERYTGSGNFRWHPPHEVETLRVGASLIAAGFEPRHAFRLAREPQGPIVLPGGWVLLRPVQRG